MHLLHTKCMPNPGVYGDGIQLAGRWNERALYDAVQICALFNFMNRIIEGTGVTFDYGATPPTDDELQARRTRTYMDYGRELGIVD